MISLTWPVMDSGRGTEWRLWKALEASEKEVSEDEKGALKHLRGFQINRQREVERLDALWTCLFKEVRNSFKCYFGEREL